MLSDDLLYNIAVTAELHTLTNCRKFQIINGKKKLIVSTFFLSGFCFTNIHD